MCANDTLQIDLATLELLEHISKNKSSRLVSSAAIASATSHRKYD